MEGRVQVVQRLASRLSQSFLSGTQGSKIGAGNGLLVVIQSDENLAAAHATNGHFEVNRHLKEI